MGILMVFLIGSCDSKKEGSEFLGKWQSEKFESGNSIVLEIEADGKLYKVDKYTVDKDGAKTDNKYDNTYVVPIRDGIMQVTPLDVISYSENDGKLYWNPWVFTKIE
ncbi:hypothetical protein MTsPCn9_34100 [Croceitalea sp. MTPC9]|nr:hypothetical protein MTsPCn6_34850 [Croceitalea sp. MTPC6]GMN18470.1 hypothetical protein MTsPCn9_34100 [Croceitalea sp. MTPC9]